MSQQQHHCHVDICDQPCPPKMLFCLAHWRMTPKRNQAEIWATYRPGQELDKHPSAAYIDAQYRARVAVLERIRRKGCVDPGEGGCIGTRCPSCQAREALDLMKPLVTRAAERVEAEESPAHA